jgi:hypothetical protein
MPREVMTLQLGGYSNFMGSHFWNIQEECMSYDGDDEESRENSEVHAGILWRQSRETVVPRLMTLDLKSERGALRRRGYLNPEEEPPAQEAFSLGDGIDPGAWGGTVASFYSEQVPVHPFVQHLLDTDAQEYDDEEMYEDDEGGWQDDRSEDDDSVPHVKKARVTGDGKGKNAVADEAPEQKGSEPDFLVEDDTVRYWSDYLKVSFHPRTCHDLSQGFGTDYTSFAAGVDWNADETLREEWEENLHWWIEECDTLQGFHIFADSDNAFGAVASSVCTQLRDDFPRTPIILAASAPHRYDRSHAQQRMHASAEAISLASLFSIANIYLPIHGPQADVSLFKLPRCLRPLPAKPSFFRTSALAAAAIDTATLSWRLRRRAGASVELMSRTGALFHGYSVASLNAYLPVPAISSAELTAARAEAASVGREEGSVAVSRCISSRRVLVDVCV